MTWLLEQTEFLNMAKCKQNEVYMDEDGLDVQLESGSGYGRESLSAFIPTETLIKLLEHQGFKVSK